MNGWGMVVLECHNTLLPCLFVPSLIISPPRFGREVPITCRYVSELCIPAYRETKLPFILPEPRGPIQRVSPILHIIGLRIDDSVRKWSFLVHTTNGAVLTAEECHGSVTKAETNGRRDGTRWDPSSTTRHVSHDGLAPS